ncbi:MAG: hypothetical protein HYZ42_17465 [Bacteroidetes bacterium]|nr:hypothetical protein [Bacteroidota bacterium]
MKGRITLQLELKDIFFCLSEVKPFHENYIGFDKKYYIKRNYLVDFIQGLAPFFDFSIWTIYTDEEAQFFSSYLTSLGANIKYCKTGYSYTFPDENGEHAITKRLKRLNVVGIKIEQLICIESEIPIQNNHNNYFIIPIFKGEEDDALLESSFKLLELKDIEDTTRINDFI